MSTEAEVASFLKDFKEKMKFWDVLFRDDRGKNAQALVDLELRPIERKTILEALQTKDYSQGPLEEILYGGADMWVFGKIIKKKRKCTSKLQWEQWAAVLSAFPFTWHSTK